MKILVSDPIAEAGLALLRKHAVVEVKTGLSPEKLQEIISDYDALIVRSETKVTKELLAAATKLRVVGRAGAGVDNINVEAATERGVLVLNAPAGNTVSAAEHTIAMMLALARHIPRADSSLKAGQWQRSRFTGVELYGKTLGVIGAGRIGSEVIRRAGALGMEIIVFDPYLAPESVEKLGAATGTLPQLLARADFITLHTPATAATRHLLGKKELALCKKGARLINCARGELVDEKALYDALVSGQLGGAALDVFAEEPAHCNPLCSLPNVIVTPHLGASTAEAQLNVAVQVAKQVIAALTGQPVLHAVNVASLPAEEFAAIQPYLSLVQMLGSFYGQLFPGQVKAVAVEYSGEIAAYPVTLLTHTFLGGLFSAYLQGTVNYVNAPLIAKKRGVKITESKTTTAEHFHNLITARISHNTGTHTIAGTVFANNDCRIVQINNYDIEIRPSRYMLLTNHRDVPGVVGRCGLILSADGINIAGMQLGRTESGGQAIMALQVDSPVPRQTLEKIRELEVISSVQFIQLAFPAPAHDFT